MTSLHVRAAAILAGDLRPDIRDVIEELAERLEAAEEIVHYYDDPDCEDDGALFLYEVWRDCLPAEPASPSTDSEAGQ